MNTCEGVHINMCIDTSIDMCIDKSIDMCTGRASTPLRSLQVPPCVRTRACMRACVRACVCVRAYACARAYVCRMCVRTFVLYVHMYVAYEHRYYGHVRWLCGVHVKAIWYFGLDSIADVEKNNAAMLGKITQPPP